MCVCVCHRAKLQQNPTNSRTSEDFTLNDIITNLRQKGDFVFESFSSQCCDANSFYWRRCDSGNETLAQICCSLILPSADIEKSF